MAEDFDVALVFAPIDCSECLSRAFSYYLARIRLPHISSGHIFVLNGYNRTWCGAGYGLLSLCNCRGMFLRGSLVPRIIEQVAANYGSGIVWKLRESLEQYKVIKILSDL